jgi:hypothetical protein
MNRKISGGLAVGAVIAAGLSFDAWKVLFTAPETPEEHLRREVAKDLTAFMKRHGLYEKTSGCAILSQAPDLTSVITGKDKDRVIIWKIAENANERGTWIAYEDPNVNMPELDGTLRMQVDESGNILRMENNHGKKVYPSTLIKFTQQSALFNLKDTKWNQIIIDDFKNRLKGLTEQLRHDAPTTP